MEILKIFGLAISAVVIIQILKEYKGVFATIVATLFGIAFFLYINSSIAKIFDYVRNMCNYVGINIIYVEVMFKVIGVSYISEFVSAVCRDSGESSIALKVDLAGKLVILLSSMPIFEELINIIVKIAA